MLSSGESPKVSTLARAYDKHDATSLTRTLHVATQHSDTNCHSKRQKTSRTPGALGLGWAPLPGCTIPGHLLPRLSSIPEHQHFQPERTPRLSVLLAQAGCLATIPAAAPSPSTQEPGQITKEGCSCHGTEVQDACSKYRLTDVAWRLPCNTPDVTSV